MLIVEAGDVGVWWRHTESLSAADTAQMLRVLSADERRRHGRFVFERDRRDFAAAHALLREALSSHGNTRPEEWRFEADARGKPRLQPQPGAAPLAFNLSHVPGLVACAVARHVEIGVDAERIGRVAEPRLVAARSFAPSEVELLETCAPGGYATRFAELWTLKEAYTKAVGAGLDMPLDSFAFAFDGPSGLRFTARSDSAGWDFLLAAPSADTRLAVAVRRTGHARPWRVSMRFAHAGRAAVPALLRWTPAFDPDSARTAAD